MLHFSIDHSIMTYHSWEIGTELEALTELEWPSLSVFQRTAFPPPAHLTHGEAADVLNITTTSDPFQLTVRDHNAEIIVTI